MALPFHCCSFGQPDKTTQSISSHRQSDKETIVRYKKDAHVIIDGVRICKQIHQQEIRMISTNSRTDRQNDRETDM